MRVLRIFLLLLLLPFTAYGRDDCQWKEVTGEAISDTITVEELGRLALKRARLSAVQEVAGIGIYGGDIVINHVLARDLIITLTEGYIVKEEILKWEADFKWSSKDKPPIPCYRVYAKCCVSTGKGERDPFFVVSAGTNKPVYFSGEEATLKIGTGRGSFITIFHLSANEKLSILLPNQFQIKQYIEEGAELIFPPQGLGLRVTTASQSKKEVEYFIVVATKEWFDFAGQIRTDRDIPLSSFYGALLSIPSQMRAIAVAGYVVLKKE